MEFRVTPNQPKKEEVKNVPENSLVASYCQAPSFGPGAREFESNWTQV